MDEHMGRRTVGGLLFTKGGSILLFREDGSRPKAKNCCTRHGCSGQHPADRAKGKEVHRAAAVGSESTPATPRRSQAFRKPNRRPPHEGSASGSIVRDVGGPCSETGSGSRDAPGRDLLARLKERVNTSRKRSLNRENSPQSPSGLSVCASSPSNSRSVSRPSHRTASRIREADEGANAGADSVVRRNAARRGSERSDDDLLLVEQVTRNQAPSEGFLSGFMARYRSDLQGELSSLDDSMEDPNGYLRFDVGGIEELENYFIFNDRHRGMRMDIDGMSYEELLALGERIGTVNTGLSDDALSACLNRRLYMPTASGSHEDCERKCSVCQEEYLAGEEVGEMACKHYYHLSCIDHWLRQKNWCPICKSVALKIN
ncbi:putative RING zinc finger domain superfamily protein isoform X1 [Zea mays]|uniref:RING-type E3 ubiquitin transferase n=1 Tax=Zea mays TaxID=4577 RepID=B4FI89_MAIZE|nr:putative RING zinc finger domain superfamily protein [Zea mays]XP_035820463.1 putative RING zinc finger domain superfamily protein isoform X1 [Zea mays]XP_035820464.1 putative RING zinc finger domain superfamily protein isoform X1 [Zea mays]ACF81832.1 unknown [Zea mays]ACG40545.1 zinc finger, C3HC4 type family protein [Zea mays]ONM14232.1 RING/U-box superfamily protein [Zea mays]|eukprot:NP_001132824.1 putative RING zinc finger domain superfamily protein [Zea mays]